MSALPRAHVWVADGDGLIDMRVTANSLNKLSQTADRGCLSGYRVSRRVTVLYRNSCYRIFFKVHWVSPIVCEIKQDNIEMDIRGMYCEGG